MNDAAVLELVASRPGITRAAVSRSLYLGASRVQATLLRLECAGLVEPTPGVQDGVACLLYTATPAGHEASVPSERRCPFCERLMPRGESCAQCTAERAAYE